MYFGHMLVVAAALVAMEWQIQPTNGRRAVTNSAWYKALQKAKQPPPPPSSNKEDKGCKGTKMENEKAKSCLKLANCHLTIGDILRNRNESYESYYNDARKEVEHFNNRFKCGQKKIYRECQEKIKSCWAMAKMMAINGLDELLFVNDCDGQTMPYSHTLCIGKKPGHWPKDIYNVMEKFYPTWCNMGCSMFREYDEFHKKSNVTEFPKDWNVGLELGLEDQDTRAMGRDIVSLAIMLSGMSTRSGLEVRNVMSESVHHDIVIYSRLQSALSDDEDAFFCYLSQATCNKTKCPRIGPDCGAKEKVTGDFIYICTSCDFDQENLIESCNYCMKPLLCDLYAQCTNCNTKTDTCLDCEVGSACERGKNESKNIVEEVCRTCSGCIDTTCQTCGGCDYHREVEPHSPEAICLFYNNCTGKVVAAVGPGTPKQRGLMDDITNCEKNVKTMDQCFKGLIPVPWIVPITASFPGGYIDPKFITFNTKSSVCRFNSWVEGIYDDLPDSIVGICLNGTHQSDSLDNRIGIPKMTPLNIGKFVNCGRGDAGIRSYIRGATIQLTNDTENGTEYIHSAKYHCSARDENIGISRTNKTFGIKGKEGKTQTKMCPQEMVVCSLRTYIANIGGKKGSEEGEKYVIVNMEFGCCDVTPDMFYSGINYMVQTKGQEVVDNDDGDYHPRSKIRTLPSDQVQTVPSFTFKPPGCKKSIARSLTDGALTRENGGEDIQDYSGCKPVTRLCPPSHFISRLGIEQFVGPYYSLSGVDKGSPIYYLLKLDFACTDYNGKSKIGTTLSEELYTNKRFFVRGVRTFDTIDCGPGKYAFGIYAALQLANFPGFGAYTNMRYIQLHCGDNENPDSDTKNITQFIPHESADKDESRPPSDFSCNEGQALCGFQLRPTSFHYSSGYDYKFICCPIPVRRFVLQSCPNGTTYDVRRDDKWEETCKNLPCGHGVAHGVISELVALPEKKPTFHNPNWHEKLRYAIVSTTNVNYGGGFSEFFDRNNRTGYITLTPVVLEPRVTTGDVITGTTKVLSLVKALTGNLSTTAGKFGVAGGVLGLALFINDQLNPKLDVVGEALAKISQQLNAIQDAIQQGRVYTEIQKLNVNLDIEFNVNVDEDRSDPRYYNVTATCGKAEYNMYGHDIFYYVPRKDCQLNFEEKWMELQESILDNSNGDTQRTFVVRFNLVGMVIQGEKRNDLSHWLKWEELIDNLKKRVGFGKKGNKAKEIYSSLSDLFKRPNSIKFYYVDVPVPAGNQAQVYQLVASCNRWQLYTKFIAFKVSADAIPLFDMEKFKGGTLVVRESNSSLS